MVWWSVGDQTIQRAGHGRAPGASERASLKWRAVAGGKKRVAVIDIGTNSTRLLVADVDADAVSEVERLTRVTRLGRGVDISGQLSPDAIEEVCETIASYVANYEELGAEAITAIATSAVRDAANGGAFIAELRERFALSAAVLDGEEEARLTYLGATSGDPPAVPTLVFDIGGGSTELIVGIGAEVSFHTSLQAGVVRHSERHISSDPPSNAGLEGLADEVRGLLDDSVSDHPEAHAETGIAVAGTPTSLAAIELELDPYDPARVHGHRLTLPSVQRMLAGLSTVPLAERKAITGLHADRAPTIVAGVVILIEVMRAFGLDEITVSEHDILYGAAIAAARSAEG
jgi:exopolyphosphatase/guanosine-5'-triphosphate,3'-diphosphate pyrophosphatase